MLKSKKNRKLLLELGVTPEELENIPAWTTYDDPMPDLTEKIVRRAKKEFAAEMKSFRKSKKPKGKKG